MPVRSIADCRFMKYTPETGFRVPSYSNRFRRLSHKSGAGARGEAFGHIIYWLKPKIYYPNANASGTHSRSPLLSRVALAVAIPEKCCKFFTHLF